MTFVFFILVNFMVFSFMASGYIRALYWSSKGIDIWQEQLNDNEDMTEEEKVSVDDNEALDLPPSMQAYRTLGITYRVSRVIVQSS